MASLIENLITGLNEEYAVYEQLLVASTEKTTAIVSNNLDRLRETTDKEQLLVDTITGLENTRRQTMKNIAGVLGQNSANLRIVDVIGLLESQPEFHDPLSEISEKLGKLAKRLKDVNAHNQNLIQESLKMIEYNINLLQNLDRAPETAEYSRDMFKRPAAYGDAGAGVSGQFDTKN